MKYIVLFAVCFALGIAFILFPRGKEYTTIYNNCTDEICPLWFSAGIDVRFQGIPFKVDSEAFSTLSDARAPSTTNNTAKTSVNFATGFVTGMTLGFVSSKRFSKKK